MGRLIKFIEFIFSWLKLDQKDKGPVCHWSCCSGWYTTKVGVIFKVDLKSRWLRLLSFPQRQKLSLNRLTEIEPCPVRNLILEVIGLCNWMESKRTMESLKIVITIVYRMLLSNYLSTLQSKWTLQIVSV